VPISVSEQIESAHEAFEAGATIAHCHVRDDEGRPTADPERFGCLKEGLEAHCPGLTVQFSTGGRSGAEGQPSYRRTPDEMISRHRSLKLGAYRSVLATDPLLHEKLNRHVGAPRRSNTPTFGSVAHIG
jgi:uncharacterized protein (DUF849 family)